MMTTSTTQVPHSTIEHLRATMPGQSIDWYIRIGQMVMEGLMPMPVANASSVATVPEKPKPAAKPIAVKVPPRKPPMPQKPIVTVSEKSKSQLIELCKGNVQSAERLVAAERGAAYSEESAWIKAYEKLMNDRMNLYANIFYNT